MISSLLSDYHHHFHYYYHYCHYFIFIQKQFLEGLCTVLFVPRGSQTAPHAKLPEGIMQWWAIWLPCRTNTYRELYVKIMFLELSLNKNWGTQIDQRPNLHHSVSNNHRLVAVQSFRPSIYAQDHMKSPCLCFMTDTKQTPAGRFTNTVRTGFCPKSAFMSACPQT